MNAKIGMISLGCPKNQVDAEIMLKKIESAGFTITKREDDADVIIVNTCGFLESAVAEAIEVILEVKDYKKIGNLKKIIITGCMAERYKDQILTEIPEADVVVSLGQNKDIVNIIKKALSGERGNFFGNKYDLPLNEDRILTTPSYTAYLKIAEGCSNCCSYCAIPFIRGKFRSRNMEDILKEAENLALNGVKELVVIAQDTTRYGEDIYNKPMLAELLQKLCKIEGIKWIRTLYTYPERYDDNLINTVKNEEKLVKYFDIPIQHSVDRILKDMNRKTTHKKIIELIEHIRKEIPGVTLRTSLICGFPGETEEDFTALAEFVKQVKFDRLGCFAYSAEDGTKAAAMLNQIEEQIKVDRAENIMELQRGIAEQKNKEKVGTVQTVLVEGYDGTLKSYYGRTAADAPEIDGKVFFKLKGKTLNALKENKKLNPGDFVEVAINDFLDYDLLGETV